MSRTSPSLAAAFASDIRNIPPPLGGVRLGATFVASTPVSVGQEIGRAPLGRSGRHARTRRRALAWAGLVAGAAAGAAWVGRAAPGALSPPAALTAALATAPAVAVAVERRRGSPSTAVRPR